MPTKNTIDFGPGLLYIDDEKFAEITKASVDTETEWVEDKSYIPRIADTLEATFECEVDGPTLNSWTLVYCHDCRQAFPITEWYALTRGKEGWLCPVCTAAKRMKELEGI